MLWPFWDVLAWIIGSSGGDDYANIIEYRVFDLDSAQSVYTWKYGAEQFSKLICPPDGPLAFLFVGYGEDRDVDWMTALIKALKMHRSGCIVAVDYTMYTKRPILEYWDALVHYEGIVAAVTDEVANFLKRGFSLENSFFFGFSLGAQIAMEVGRQLKGRTGRQVKRLDLCDPTGIGFPVTQDSKLSGTNVQCIHTNSMMCGTKKRDCHQDWNMGRCGYRQPLTKTTTSHWQCPEFYISAFENDFLAIERPDHCRATERVGKIPLGFKMGYHENRMPLGEFYANTTKDPPFNG